MIFFRTLGIIFGVSLALNVNLSSQAQIHQSDWKNKYNFSQDLSTHNKVAQTLDTIPTFTKLAGSSEAGSTITNQNASLACRLKKWELIGIFRNNKIKKTKGELTFQITNNGNDSQTFVLAELLFLNDLETPVTVHNPHRQLQGEFIKLEPPLEPGETREYISSMNYKSNWHKVDLKTCRWLERGSDYWEIYPELKPESRK